MASLEREIFNPRTRQRMKFIELRPELLRIESSNPATAEREPVHVHPKQTSGAEVTSGSLTFEIEGSERRVAAGESISVPPDTPHRFWNSGNETARSIQFFEPALETAAFFETLFALAADGKVDSKGMPHLLQLAVMVPEFANEIRPVSPPWPVLRALAAVLTPLARARGYQSRIQAVAA